MQILKETGIDWRERRLISNLYMAQSVKVRRNRGETRSVKIERGVRKGCYVGNFIYRNGCAKEISKKIEDRKNKK